MGLDTKYGKMKEYVKKVIVDKTDKQSNHSNFLAALKTWMDEHNQNPDMTRLKDKDAVMNLQDHGKPSQSSETFVHFERRLEWTEVRPLVWA